MVWVTKKKKKKKRFYFYYHSLARIKKNPRLPAVNGGSYETGVAGRDCLNWQRMQERRAACMLGQQMISMIFWGDSRENKRDNSIQ